MLAEIGMQGTRVGVWAGCSTQRPTSPHPPTQACRHRHPAWGPCTGVMGAKHTATLIPLCHTLLLAKVDVALALDAPGAAVLVTATARTVGPTGVEMEALTAAAVAALCVYDMCKAASKAIVVTDLRLLSKSGGKSGAWRRGGTEAAGGGTEVARGQVASPHRGSISSPSCPMTE